VPVSAVLFMTEQPTDEWLIALATRHTLRIGIMVQYGFSHLLVTSDVIQERQEASRSV
jgi:hypothetical protein